MVKATHIVDSEIQTLQRIVLRLRDSQEPGGRVDDRTCSSSVCGEGICKLPSNEKVSEYDAMRKTLPCGITIRVVPVSTIPDVLAIIGRREEPYEMD